MQSNLQSNYRYNAAAGKLIMHAAALPTGHEGKQTRWQRYTHCTTHVCTRTHTHTQFAIYWSVVLRRVADCSSAVAGWLRSSWCWGCCERFCSWTRVMPAWTRLASDHIFGQFHFHVQFVSIMCMDAPFHVVRVCDFWWVWLLLWLWAGWLHDLRCGTVLSKRVFYDQLCYVVQWQCKVAMFLSNQSWSHSCVLSEFTFRHMYCGDTYLLTRSTGT